MGSQSSQGGDLCHVLRLFFFLHLGVKETLSLASCPSPSCPITLSCVPPQVIVGAQTHTYTKNCRCLGQQTTGETTSPLLTLEGGKGTGLGTCLVPSTCLGPHNQLAYQPKPSGLVATPQPLLDLANQFWPRRTDHLFSHILKSDVGGLAGCVPQSLLEYFHSSSDPARAMPTEKGGNQG